MEHFPILWKVFYLQTYSKKFRVGRIKYLGYQGAHIQLRNQGFLIPDGRNKQYKSTHLSWRGHCDMYQRVLQYSMLRHTVLYIIKCYDTGCFGTLCYLLWHTRVQSIYHIVIWCCGILWYLSYSAMMLWQTVLSIIKCYATESFGTLCYLS